MTLSANPPHARADGSTLVAFDGPPSVVVAWRVEIGPGHLEPLTETTDATGRAFAVYYPDGGTGSARIEVRHGT